MRSVSAVFMNVNSTGKAYEYFVRDGDNPAEGDLIVTSVSNLHEKINIARVTCVNAEASDKATKPYLMLISMSELNRRASAAIAEAKRLADRKAALGKLRDLAEAKALIASLRGSDDPEIVALIKTIEG